MKVTKVEYYCEMCGKVIDDEPAKMYIDLVDREHEIETNKNPEGWDDLSLGHWHRECMQQIIRFALGKEMTEPTSGDVVEFVETSDDRIQFTQEDVYEVMETILGESEEPEEEAEKIKSTSEELKEEVSAELEEDLPKKKKRGPYKKSGANVGSTKRLPLDDGTIKALFIAGKTPDWIAEDLNVSKVKVNNRIRAMRARGEIA